MLWLKLLYEKLFSTWIIDVPSPIYWVIRRVKLKRSQMRTESHHIYKKMILDLLSYMLLNFLSFLIF